MRILLIGRQGQLGAELEKILTTPRIRLFAFGHTELDIRDYSATQKIIKTIRPDIVINTSAYHVLADCEKYPQKAFEVNAFALRNLAEICRDQKIRLVTYSTDYVFDGTKGKPYTETDRTNPIQMYGLSKLAGEIICLNYNPRSIVIRTCGVYGGPQGSKAKKGNIVLTLLNEDKNKTTLEVSSEQIVSPTYAQDLAEGTIKLLTKSDTAGMYHLVNEGYCSWYEFAKEIVTLKKLKNRIKPVDRHGKFGDVKRPLFSALLNTRAKTAGIVLPPWQDGLKRYLSCT